MKKLLLILLIVPAFAFADSIHFGIFTGHFDGRDTWNNDNQLVAVEFDEFFFASFVNSYRQQSYAAGKSLSLTRHASILYGVSHGYNSECFWALGGSYDTCTENIDKPEFLPFATFRLRKTFGNFHVSAMASNYLSLSVGHSF